MAELLEYIIRLRGGAAAGAEVRGLAAEVRKLGAANASTAAESAAADEAATASSRRRAAAMGLMTKASRVGALAIAATAFEAVKMSNTFDTEMLKIRTDAGASTAELQFMHGAVLDLAKSGKSMGQGPESLAQGLYHLESLGIRGSKAIHALELSSQASAISGANLEETTSALGAALFVGIKGAGGMDHVMALLNATVGQGNMRMGELVHALGTGVLPAAKVAGLGIKDVMAALAVFSDSGQNASSAAAQFATSLHFMYHPTTKAADALSGIGLGGDKLARDLRKPNGMVTALKDLRDHLDRLPGGAKGIAAEKVLGDILPGGRGRILLTELTMLDRAQQKWDNIGEQATTARWRDAVNLQKQNPATQLATALSQAQGHLIEFGHRVGPILVPILVAVMGVLGKIVGLFAAVPAIPVILFVGLLTLGFVALAKSIGLGALRLAEFALGIPAATAETTALTAATAELAVAEDAAGASAVGMGGRLGALGARLSMLGAGWLALGAAAVWGTSKLLGSMGDLLAAPTQAGIAADADPTVQRVRKWGHSHHGAIKRFDDTHRKLVNAPLTATNLRHRLALGDPGLVPGTPDVPRDYHPGHPYSAAAMKRSFGGVHVVPATAEALGLPRGAKVSGDIVLKVDGRELVRATRKQILEAQARG